MVALIVFITATLKTVLAEKNYWTQKVDNPAKGTALMPNHLKLRLPYANAHFDRLPEFFGNNDPANEQH